MKIITIRIFIIIILIVSIYSCDKPSVYDTSHNFNLSGKFISLNNNNDTINVFDTLELKLSMPNPITTDEGQILNINKEINVQYAYHIKKCNAETNWKFDYAPNFLELNKNSTFEPGYKGGVYAFNGFQRPLINETIKYVPQDTGFYMIFFNSHPSLTCMTSEFKDPISLNLTADFNVPNNNLDMIKFKPDTYNGRIYEDTTYGLKYYFFYVKQ